MMHNLDLNGFLGGEENILFTISGGGLFMGGDY